MRRIDLELVHRQLAKSRTQAYQYLQQNRVICENKTITKPSTQVLPNQTIRLLPPTNPTEYVSRSGNKLAEALQKFSEIKTQNTICLDVGAATGGFTDVLLQKGAKQVIALDVGHSQLDPKIRHNPKVIVKEHTNIKDVVAQNLNNTPDIIVVDISFISLTKVITTIVKLTKTTTNMLLLIKPQFEVGKQKLKNKGIVTEISDQVFAIKEVVKVAQNNQLYLQGLVKNTLLGLHGNQEYFAWFNFTPSFKNKDFSQHIQNIVSGMESCKEK